MPWIGMTITGLALIFLLWVSLSHYINHLQWEEELARLAECSDENSVRTEFSILKKRSTEQHATKITVRFLILLVLLGLAVGLLEATR